MDKETDPATKHKAAVWELCGLILALTVGALLVLGAIGLVLWKFGYLEEKKRAEEKQVKNVTPIEIQTITHQKLEDRIRLPGIIRPWLEAAVPAEVAGRVIRLPVAEGKKVKKGTVLVELDDRDFKIRLKQAEAALKLAKANCHRTRKLTRQGVKTPADLDHDESTLQQAEASVEAARLNLSRCRITSPFAGVVDDILPEIGEWLSAGAKVAQVLDTQKVKIEIGIPEEDISCVRKLKRCRVVIDAVRKGHSVMGEVVYVSSQPIREALVYNLRLMVKNPDQLLIPGMFVEADLIRQIRENSMVIPLYSVLPMEKAHFIFVANDGIARRRKITLGIMQKRGEDQMVEIFPVGEKRVKAGDRLIVLGQHSVEDGSQVKVIRARPSPTEHR